MTLEELGPPKSEPSAGTRSGKPGKETASKNKEPGKETGKEAAPKLPREAKPLRESQPSRALVENKEKDKGNDLYRWYEIKAKDNLVSIARDNLESANRWQEIKKLNPDLNPQKMKPGDRIKVPRAKPLSRAIDIGRESA